VLADIPIITPCEDSIRFFPNTARYIKFDHLLGFNQAVSSPDKLPLVKMNSARVFPFRYPGFLVLGTVARGFFMQKPNYGENPQLDHLRVNAKSPRTLFDKILVWF
jgi:hypothetical protein